jgi:hypothetical protein
MILRRRYPSRDLRWLAELEGEYADRLAELVVED